MSRTRGRQRSAVLGLALSLAVGVAAGAQAPLPPDLAEYLAIVGEYRAGRVPAAVRRIRVWDGSRIERVIKAMPEALEGKVGTCADRPDFVAAATLDAAVLLHTEAAVTAFGQARDDEALDQLNDAHMLLSWVPKRAAEARAKDRTGCDAPPPLQRRDWLLVASLAALKAWAIPSARTLADALLEAAPGDADALFVVGAVREGQAANDALYAPPAGRPAGGASGDAARSRRQVNGEVQRDIRRQREEAARLFRQALARDPDRPEIRLRLGWVQHQLGAEDEARATLERLPQEAPTTAERYLAALFLGRVEQSLGRLDAALRWYDTAAATDPEAPAARTAQAHVFDLQGDRERARDIVRASLSRTPPAAEDPWAAYPLGPWTLGESTLDRLRKAVTTR